MATQVNLDRESIDSQSLDAATVRKRSRLGYWTYVTSMIVCTAIAPASPPDLYGQAPEPQFSASSSGFTAPPASLPQQPAPGIFRPQTRTAGVPVQVSSAVTPATWTSPSTQPQRVATATTKSTAAESGIPFNPPATDTDATTLKKPSSTWSSTISMVVSLMLVLAIFMGVAWFFRSVAPQPSRTLSKDVVQVLGRTPLAPRQQMILIRFGRKLVLVSQQLGHTQTLSEIDDPREVDHLLGLCEQSSASSISSSFRDVLYQMASGKVSDRSSVMATNLSIVREAST